MILGELEKQVQQMSTMMETTESTRSQIQGHAGDLQRALEDERRERQKVMQVCSIIRNKFI